MGKVFGKIAKIGLVIAAVAVNVIPGAGQAVSAGIFGSLVGAAGLSAAATIASLAPLTVTALGAATALGMLQKKPQTSPSQLDRLNANIVVDAPRKTCLGYTALATDIRYQEWNGSDQDIVDQVLVVASHRVGSIDEIWLEEKLAWTATGGTQGSFAGYFFVDTILEASHSNAFTIEQNRWTPATAAMIGCAQAHFRFKVSGNSKKATSPFSSGVPTRITIIGQAAPLYDPRFDGSVGGNGPMRVDDQSTWAFIESGTEVGRNNALALLFYLLGWRIKNPSTGTMKLAIGLGIPVDRIDLDSFMTGANACDEPVTKADGTTNPRYRCDGQFSESDEPNTVIDSITASMNAVLRDAGGKLTLQVLHNDLATPVIDFGDDDVLGQFTWSAGNALNDRKNVVKGQYTDPSNNSLYQLVDYPAVSLPSLDGIDRIDTVDYALVEDPGQAQRLAKQRLQRAQYAGTFAADFNAKGWAVKDGDIVRLTFSALGFQQKLFRVGQATIQVSGVSPLILIEENAAIYAWDAEESPAVQAAAPNTFDPLLLPIIQAIGEAGGTADWPNVTDPAGTKPSDNADVTADAFAIASGGKTIEQVIVSIDSLTTQTEDLVATYGDTESAAAAASAAQAAESAAQSAQANAGTARDQAQAAFTAADAARQTAAASASSASTYADGAASDMNAAGTSASAAHQSEVNAGLAATQAAGSASGASSSASSAAASQTAAGQSASAANTSATNAATSAGQASTFAGSASTSASNASTSATNASGSANQASTYASQASGSATNASTSATSAATQASNAQSSATAAGASATSASTSANTAQGYAGNASTSANSAQSSAASASGSAAAAQQSATLSASVTGAYLNANPAFAAYPTSPGVPSGWADYVNGGIGTRVAGTAGGNAYRVVAPANADQGIYQHAIYLSAGYYVIEMGAYCEAGDWSGAGIQIQDASTGAGIVSLNCSVDPSLDNVAGAGGTGVRQWAKFVQVPTSGSIDMVALTNAGIFGTRDAKTLDWYRAAIRPASDAEVAGKRADTNASTALAQISTEQSVRASADTALASQISSLTSTVGSNTSNISSLQTTVATNAASAAQAVSTLSAYATAAPNLCLDVDKWPTLSPGMSVVHDPFWGLAIEGIPQIATNSLSVIAQSPLISIGQANAYCASADLYCFGSSGAFVGLDWVGIDAGGKGTAFSPQPLVYANTDFSNSRPRIAAAAGTPSTTAYGYLRLLGYIPSGGTVQTMGLRRPKFEQGGIPTAYTSEAQLVSLSSSVSVLTATTSNLAARVNTAVFQVTAQAGNSRALLRILADGYGQSSVDLVAGSINLWSQDGSTAIQALSIDSSGLVTIPNLAVGQISVQHVAYGATGTVSIWDNEPNATWNSPSSWGTFCQIEMTPSQGAPVLGQFAGRLVSSSAASVDVKLRVRRDDGTIVKGGNDGTGQVFRTNTGGTSISINWIDTVNAGRDTTWFLDVMIADGTSNGIAIEGGCGWVQEYTRSAYQHATIKTVSGTGPGAGTGGGGNVNGHGLGFACPEQSEPVLLANAALDGPGGTIPAGQLRAGMWLWTQHEKTFEWGAYRVTFVGLVEDDLWAAPDRALTSPSHLWRIGEEWVRMDAIGKPLGRRGTVVSLQVEGAHTYVVGGDLSHNKTVQN